MGDKKFDRIRRFRFKPFVKIPLKGGKRLAGFIVGTAKKYNPKKYYDKRKEEKK